MARGTLHAGKPDGARRRRNAPTHSETRLVRDDEVRGLPIDEATGSEDWLPETVKWWETWRHAPQAQVFEGTDWSRLAMLAAIVDRYFQKPSAAALGEIRMSEERLGATVVDRMRARMRVEDQDPGDGEGGSVVSIASRRSDVAARLKGGE